MCACIPINNKLHLSLYMVATILKVSLLTALRVMSGWWEEGRLEREGWKFVQEMYGVLFAVKTGTKMMRESCAGNCFQDWIWMVILVH